MPAVSGYTGRTGRGTLHSQVPQKLSTCCLLEHRCERSWSAWSCWATPAVCLHLTPAPQEQQLGSAGPAKAGTSLVFGGPWFKQWGARCSTRAAVAYECWEAGMSAPKEGMRLKMRLGLSGTFWKVKLGPKVLIIVGFGRIRAFTEVYYCWSKSCRVLNHRKMPPLFFLTGSYF